MAGRRRQILQLEGGIGRSDCGGEFVSARQCVCACVFYIVSAKTPPHEVISGVSLSTRTRVYLYVRTCIVTLFVYVSLAGYIATPLLLQEKSLWLFVAPTVLPCFVIQCVILLQKMGGGEEAVNNNKNYYYYT